MVMSWFVWHETMCMDLEIYNIEHHSFCDEKLIFKFSFILAWLNFVGSIVSKKAAESLNALVLDVKVGSAAFMKTEEEARDLAKSMVVLFLIFLFS